MPVGCLARRREGEGERRRARGCGMSFSSTHRNQPPPPCATRTAFPSDHSKENSQMGVGRWRARSSPCGGLEL